MARKPRIHIPGSFYHVILRGNARQDVFFQDSDRLFVCKLLEEGTKRFGYRVHAFCLMPNHIHLLVQVGNIPLSRIIQNLACRYTRRINHKYESCGHLFQGRYKAILIDAETHLLELVRYVHLNPIRSGLVDDLRAYYWSSHTTYLGEAKYSWVTTYTILGRFADVVGEARLRYEKFVYDGIGQGPSLEFKGKGLTDGRILGDEGFASEVLRQAGSNLYRPASILEVAEQICKLHDFELEDIALRGKGRKASEMRALLALVVRDIGSSSLTELSRYLNRDVASLSKAARRLEKRAEVDRQLAERLLRLRHTIHQMPKCQA